MKIRKDCLPKKAKAAVVELIGEFPEDGENFKIRKKEEKCPDGFNMYWAEKITSFGKTDGRPLYEKTKILQEYGIGIYRYWQSAEKSIVLLPEIITYLISGQTIKDIETAPEGPYKIDKYGHFAEVMYWWNNTGELYVLTGDCPQKDSAEERLLQRLEEIVLPGHLDK